MSTNGINDDLLKQYHRTIEMLKQAINNFSDDTWMKSGGIRPAGIAAHAVETLDFYTSQKPVDEFPWGKRTGCDWEDSPDEELPEKSSLMDYLVSIEDQVNEFISTSILTDKETICPWTGDQIIGKCLYALRHTQHNVGQLSGALLSSNQPGLDWK